MDRTRFEAVIDEWIADFRDEILRAFETGCLPAETFQIATSIANSRMNKRQLDLAAAGGVVGVRGALRGSH